MAVPVIDTAAQAEVELSPAEAQARWLAGDVALQPGTVAVRRGKSTGTVSTNDLPTALAEGWSLSDDDEREALTLQREESDAGSLALGAIERALSGATLGLSTQALVGAGLVDEQRAAARAAELGGFGQALEIAGAILPGLATGGGSAGATAAGTLARAGAGRGALALAGRAATAPARAAARLGARTEAAALGATRSSALSLGARGSVEGVLFEGGQMLDENALGQRDLVAEQVLADLGMAGLFGAGAGALLPGIAKVGAGAAKAPIAGMRRVFGRSRGVGEATELAADAANDVGVLESLVRAQARATGADEEAAARLLRADDLPLLERVRKDHGKVSVEIANDVQRAWNAVSDDTAGVMSRSLGVKEQQLRKAIPRELDDVAPRAAADEVAAIRAEIDGARAYNADAPGSYLRLELDRIDDAAKSAAFELGEGVDAAHAMVQLGRLRSRIDEVVETTGGFGKRAPAVSDAAWATNQQARKLRDRVRKMMRDEQLFGGGARLQADIDDSIAAFHAARREFADLHRGGYGAGIAGQQAPMTADQAIKLVRSYGRHGGDAKRGALEDLLDKRVAQLQTVRRHFDLDDAALAQIDDALRNADDVRGALKKNAKAAAYADDFAALRAAEGDRSPSIHMLTTMGPSVLGSIGFGLGGPIGAAAGMAAGIATRPYATAQLLTRLRVLGAIDERAAGVGSRMAGIVERATSGFAGAAGRVGGRSGGAVGAAAAGRDRPKFSAEQVRERAARYATNPTAIADDSRAALFDLDRHAPGVAGIVRARHQVAAQYLAASAPTVMRSPFTGRTASDPVERQKFERRVEAVLDPVGVLERGIKSRSLAPEQVEAIRVVYPTIYQSLQQEIVGAALEAAGRGEPLPYRDRVTLGLLFDIELDPSLNPQSIARTHAIFGASSSQSTPPQGPPTRPGRLSVASTTQTPIEKLG